MDSGQLSFRITITGALLFSCLRTGNTEITVPPSNTEAVVGSSTYFNCSTSLTSEEIHWFHYDTINQERTFVYGYRQFYTPYQGRFQMDTSGATGAFNLVIPSVEIGDAGIYECVDDVGRGEKKSAQLVVLDTDLICQSDTDTVIGPNSCEIEPNQLILSCMVTYHGNEAPVLEWRLDNSAITHGVNRTIINSRVIYHLTIMGSNTENGSSYVCHVKRSTSESSCNSRTISVQGKTNVCQECYDCKSFENAIICICTIILFLCVSLIIMCIFGWRWKRSANKLSCAKDTTSDELTVTNLSFDAVGEGRPLTQDTSCTNKELQSTNSIQRRDNSIPILQAEAKERAAENVSLKSKMMQLEADVKERVAENESLKSRITQLEADVKERAAENESLKSKITQLEADVKERVAENESLKSKLKAKVIQFEQQPYLTETMEFTDKPELAQIIVSTPTEKDKKDTKSIGGITILDHELFVIYAESPTIEVYDSVTFRHNRHWVITDLKFPVDIASCTVTNCLYIIETVKEESNQPSESTKPESIILKLDPKGELLNQWATGGGTGRLSTYQSKVIVCLFAEQLIKEYSADGNEITRVRLSPAAGFFHPLHAIKVNSSYFVVSHGNVGDDVHRVCVVDSEGKIIKSLHKWERWILGRKTSESFKMPVSLLDIGEGSIMVADFGEKRIVILSSILGFQKELIDKGNGLDGRPVRLCFDSPKGRLFVAVNKWDSNKEQWKNGRILVFNVK